MDVAVPYRGIYLSIDTGSWLLNPFANTIVAIVVANFASGLGPLLEQVLRGLYFLFPIRHELGRVLQGWTRKREMISARFLALPMPMPRRALAVYPYSPLLFYHFARGLSAV
eukprot:5152417-Pleurochrysis_carterae.AAC.4